MRVERAGGLLLGLAAALGCSDLTTTDQGVAALVVDAPVPAEVEVGQTLQLVAHALGAGGDTLDVPVIWRALDTTIVVDSVQGLLTGVVGGQRGTVVARVAQLTVTIMFQVLFRADTLVRLAPDTMTVASGQLSGELNVRLEAGSPPQPVPNRRIVFQVVLPEFAAPDERTVEFPGGALLRTATTAAGGSPSPGVRLATVTGKTPPDSAVVEVSAFRPGGEAIPGSGLRFILRFAAP